MQYIWKSFKENLKSIFLFVYLFFSGFRRKRDRPFGVNLIGPVRWEYGLGESCRILVDVLEASGVPFSVLCTRLFKKKSEKDKTKIVYETKELPYAVNLLHVNTDVLPTVLFRYGTKISFSNYSIAYLLWEVPEYPKEWVRMLKAYDEIWTPSEFLTSVFKKYTSKPVHTIHYGLSMPKISFEYDRKHFDLPDDKFLFLFSYNGGSNTERKNPWAVLRAYKLAFPEENKNVGLVIKATDTTDSEKKTLWNEMQGYENVYILPDSMKKEEFNSLVKNADVYVSLHRAEGFGLVLAEAMLLGTPVIATDWSANTEFMNAEVSCPVPARVVELKQDYPPYRKGFHWAEPDESAAAEYMVRLLNDKAYYERLAVKAQKHISYLYDVAKAGTEMRARLEEIRREQNL